MIKSSNKNIASEQQIKPTLMDISLIKRILRYAGVTYIRPTIDPHIQQGIVFQDADLLFGTESRETEKILENLTSMGVLNKLLLDIIKTCPYCDSPLIDIKHVCPGCGSKNISRINHELRCDSCSAIFMSPKLSLVCKKCNKSFDASQAGSKPLFSYLISEDTDIMKEATNEIVLTGRLHISDVLTKNLKATLEGFLQKMDEVLSNYLGKIYQIESTASYISKKSDEAVQKTLPAHLDKTLQALRFLGKATAMEVASQTGRTRAIESVYLNQLLNLGIVEKERIGRKCYYHIK
ncbi:MAG: hypothetical protein QXZ17_02350 [Nitrososphaerota archaeon]